MLGSPLLVLFAAVCWLAAAAASGGGGAAAAKAAATAAARGRGSSQKPCQFLSQCGCRVTRSALLVSCKEVNVGARVPLPALKKSGLLAATGGGSGGNGTSARLLLALRMVRGNLSTVQSAAFAGLPVSIVDVSYNQIRLVDEDAFAGNASAAHLGVLKLNGNLLTELPAGVLRGLVGLRVLEVAHNKLTSLGFVCRQPLPRLRLLSARGNAVRRLETGCWRNFTGLAYVDLAGNALSALPLDAFDSLAGSLQKLDLSENSLAHLRPRAFAKLRALIELRLSGNRLASISFLCNVELPNLSYAILSKNRISAIDKDCWSGGDRPSRADDGTSFANGTSSASGVELAAADRGGGGGGVASPRSRWRALPRLRDLLLSGNKLRSMEAVCGAALPALGRLSLDRNLIRQVPADCFANKTALHSVTMSDNKLAKLDCCLGFEGTKVRHVDVSHNLIRSVSDQFVASTPHLSSLHLQDNYLGSLAFLCSSSGGSGGGGPEGTRRVAAAAKLHVTVDDALQVNIGKECLVEQKRGKLTFSTPGGLESSLLSGAVRSSASPS